MIRQAILCALYLLALLHHSVALPCSDISGNWRGSWSETSCDGYSDSGTWTGYVSSDCHFSGASNWNTVTGTIDPSTKVLTASGISAEGCGSITVTGTFTSDFVSGNYTYSNGGGGSFIGSPAENFIDVPPGYWAEEFIGIIYEAGITSGCSQNPLLYCPEDPVTRAEMAVFLERGINGSDYSPPGATGVFDDCPVSHWAADWIEQFYADGITSGCSTNPLMYCPDDLVTRAQMAVFLLRSMYGNSYTPPSAEGIFDDVPVTHWASDWIEQLYDEGITGGCSSNPPLYCPDDTVTRAQMAVFIVRAFDL